MPPRIPAVSVHSVTASTILLTWSVPAGSVVDNYDIEWRSEGDVGTATISGETPVYTIRNLKSDASYAIVVTARNAAGSAQSNVTTISTTTPVSIPAPVSGMNTLVDQAIYFPAELSFFSYSVRSYGLTFSVHQKRTAALVVQQLEQE